MKKITAKVITISSQILVVSLFVISLFMGTNNNDKVTVVNNCINREDVLLKIKEYRKIRCINNFFNLILT